MFPVFFPGRTNTVRDMIRHAICRDIFRLPFEGTYRYTKCVDALPGEGKLAAQQTDEVSYQKYTPHLPFGHLPLKGKAVI